MLDPQLGDEKRSHLKSSKWYSSNNIKPPRHTTVSNT